MENALKEKLIGVVRNGALYHTFTQAEVNEIIHTLTSAELPQLVDSKTAMNHLQCDKNRLNYYLNHGYLKRVKFGHRKIMVDYNSLCQFMTHGIAGGVK